MSIKLYHWAPSAPSRCVYLTLKTMGIPFEVEEVDESSREQYSPEYLAKNPKYVVPTLDDNGLILWESRAIVAYLVDKYGKPNDNLYPANPQSRAIVDQRLFFDASLLYPAVRNIVHSVIFGGYLKVPTALEKRLNLALSDLNIFLDYDDFACGNTLTIADISLYTTVTSIQAINLDLKQFKNIEKWIRRCSNHILGTEENIKGCEMFASLFLSRLKIKQSKEPKSNETQSTCLKTNTEKTTETSIHE